jgi:uncharacterized protein YukJ
VESALENMGISRVLEQGCVTVYAGVKERLALHHMGLNTPGEADHMYLQRMKFFQVQNLRPFPFDFSENTQHLCNMLQPNFEYSTTSRKSTSLFLSSLFSPLLKKGTKVGLVNKLGEGNSPHVLRHANTGQKRKWARPRAGYL